MSTPWSTQNNLSTNTDETKEIIFHCHAARNLSILPPLPGIERVKQALLLGADVMDTLSISYHFFNRPVYNALCCISS